MFSSALRTVALVASAIVLLSWGLFAIDQTREASGESVAGVTRTPTGQVAPPKPEDPEGLRGTIDDVAGLFTGPFDSFVEDSGSAWVRHSIPALLALLLWGVGLGFLARFGEGRA